MYMYFKVLLPSSTTPGLQTQTLRLSFGNDLGDYAGSMASRVNSAMANLHQIQISVSCAKKKADFAGETFSEARYFETNGIFETKSKAVSLTRGDDSR